MTMVVVHLFSLMLPILFNPTLSQSSRTSFDKANLAPQSILVRDVAIVGGGASGTYAAIRLQQDFNKTVILNEQKDELGGHTETYHEPETGSTIDLGVIVYLDLPIVREFFARFDIPLTEQSFTTQTLYNLDFRTCASVSLPFTSTETAAAWTRYATQLARYPTLNEGFIFPNPIPQDLLLPFGEFVRKYNLAAIVPGVWSIAEGYGDILTMPTVYMMKICGPQILRDLSTGFLTTSRRNNHEVYEKALNVLGEESNVLLEGSVATMRRDDDAPFIDIVVDTPDDEYLVRARQVLFAIPPTLENLDRIDLNKQEEELFSKFQGFVYSTGLLRNVPIDQETTFVNLAMDSSEFYLPRLPTTYFLGRTYAPSDLVSFKFGSNSSMDADQVRDQIVTDAMRIVPGAKPEFVAFRQHSRFALQVSADEIESGFYERLFKLQGRRRSFWTGAAWHVQDSSMLWNFTEGVLARMQENWST